MSAEVSVFAPMAAEGAVDTGQAPAETQTVRGREASPRGEGAGALAPDGRPASESHSQGVGTPSPENCGFSL